MIFFFNQILYKFSQSSLESEFPRSRLEPEKYILSWLRKHFNCPGVINCEFNWLVHYYYVSILSYICLF